MFIKVKYKWKEQIKLPEQILLLCSFEIKFIKYEAPIWEFLLDQCMNKLKTVPIVQLCI